MHEDHLTAIRNRDDHVTAQNHWSTPVVKDGYLYGMFSFKAVSYTHLWVESLTAVVEHLDRSFEVITYGDFCRRSNRKPKGMILPMTETTEDDEDEQEFVEEIRTTDHEQPVAAAV